jgi:transposase
MTLTADERGDLEVVIRKRSGSAALARRVRRARFVLLWADGERRVDIRFKLACNDAFVTRWTRAFELQGLAQDR